MLTKQELKYYSSLLNKKYRTKEGKFILEGERLVRDGLTSDYRCELVIVSGNYEKQSYDFKDSGIRVEEVSEIEFKKVSDTKNPQGIAAVFLKPAKRQVLNSDLIVAMEHISDPGNLGTILRTCDWFGVKEIMLSEQCADVYNPKTLRSGMGAVFHTNVLEDGNFYSTLGSLRKEGYKILCADLDGENLFEFKRPAKSVLVVCNEANGPTEELLNIVDIKITIPRLGKAESLNVAGAAAVIISNLTKP